MISFRFIKKENRAVAFDNEIKIGECEFKESENIWNIIHTSVDKKYQGQNNAYRYPRTKICSSNSR